MGLPQTGPRRLLGYGKLSDIGHECLRHVLVLLLLPVLGWCQAEVSVRLYWRHPDHKDARTIKIPLEDYVAGVVAGEAGGLRSTEALKAMAVAARTYAHRFDTRHSGEGFGFCATTHCQHYRAEASSARVRAAVEATKGERLWFEGRPAATYYHRHCGGNTAGAAEAWSAEAAPYLIGQEDSFCIARGREPWHATIDAAKLGAHSLEVVERAPSGRVSRIAVDGAVWGAERFHIAVGRTLGWDLLRSTFYEVRQAGDRFLFQGHGAGHGVGLCQLGAEARGAAGHSYRDILAFYYPGAKLGIAAQGFQWTHMGGERVDVYSTKPGSNRGAVAMANRALAEAERRSGLSYNQRPRVRIYPSVAAFRDATGEPGWVAGSVRGRTVRLQPSAVAADTLLHEMLHLVLASEAHPSLPWWFREGLTLYLAGDREIGAGPRSGDYAAARRRVEELVERFGRDQVLEWLRRGLPAEVAGG